MEQKGFLIAIEGIDGCGKSTLSNEIKKQLEASNRHVLLTRESGGTPLGRDLRVLLHEREEHMSDKAEFLIFAADRAQHFEKVVIPALQENKVVISDRLHYSSLAYQGFGRGLDLQKIRTINAWAMNDIEPDLIIYIKLDFQTALERILLRGGKLTSFETEKELFWKRVNDGFNEIFKSMPNVITLDGRKPADELAAEATQEILKHL